MFYVLCKSRKLCLPIDILLQLFDAIISLILLYGSEVWRYDNNGIIESLHLEFCKYIMKVKNLNSKLYCIWRTWENTVPISVAIKARMICFWDEF